MYVSTSLDMYTVMYMLMYMYMYVYMHRVMYVHNYAGHVKLKNIFADMKTFINKINRISPLTL